MEFVALKKSRNRKRKRNVKNKRRVKRKLEVKASTRRKSFFDRSTMDARSFWENYELAQEWQQNHSVAWWKSRCYALEHENNVLRQKVRSQAFQREEPTSSHASESRAKPTRIARGSESQRNESTDDEDDNLEFQVDENMLDFLEQSIRHKMELKRSRESETATASAKKDEDTEFVFCEARIIAKAEDARLLYGEASPRIMAMEAALQATIDRHKDRANPHYWPNIPLKP